MNLKIFLHKYLTPRHIITKIVGKFASKKCGKLTSLAIKGFIKLNKVNMYEAKYPDVDHYKTFNEFFIRDIQEEARPLGEDQFVSPADGKVAMLGIINNGTMIQAKGHDFTVRELLAISKEEASQFDNCSYLTVYLSPRDYHKVHMPCDGKLLKAIFIPGDLYSVNDNAFNNIPNLYARNERLVCYFETEFGLMVQVLVGATITGSILQFWEDSLEINHSVHIIEKDYSESNIIIKKGEQMGAFVMGSTTINIFPGQLGFDVSGIGVGEPIKVRSNIGNLEEMSK
ncbi:phosphatidylserine decarboxylase [Psittacicella hinzii]|uniref:Phosphatidylserine decarboxylase proenzyme n=1 Tax=Psittacicella hinzii TaxID=2028575 RepID=A0A3A1Y7D4_9GAMM|nr:archaetidylserine decarboxylase [Psittacicella hinzii]RIY33128.1 phosphatidylserine decarboxylase [Psittacicella hinzii]